MLLLCGRIKSAQRSEVIVFLGRDRPHLIDVIGHSSRWCEIKVRESLVGVIENRIDNDVVTVQMPADNRAEFLAILLLIPVSRVPAELEIHTIEKELIGRIGFHK